MIFSLSTHWYLYVTFFTLIIFLLFFDLVYLNKKDSVMTLKKAALLTAFWTSLALIFAVSLYFRVLNEKDFYIIKDSILESNVVAKSVFIDFITAYLVEETLSVDNMFVFIILFSFFKIENKYQHRVLFYGIIGAIVFRAIFIAIAAYLVNFTWILWVFGIFLFWTGFKVLTSSNDENPTEGRAIKFLQKFLPLTDKLHGEKFFVKEGSRWVGTPLFLTLCAVEISDLTFAVDSIPAVVAITKEPFIMYSSNIFAILGLRSMYFLLAALMPKFHYFKYGLGIILIFISLKMTIIHYLFPNFPSILSLAIILTILIGSIILSWLFPKCLDKQAI